MDSDYPAHLLAREPAPPYHGEGPFAVWHLSEDPSLGRFLPRGRAADPGTRQLVWAVDTRHAPMFWFPRDCPRGCIWPVSATTPQDREEFFGHTDANRIHVMEAGWLRRMQECRLYAYRLPHEAFRPHAVGGYWVADDAVEATEQVVISDLVAKHADAGIELRITPSIWPFWRRVANSTVEFSGSRLRNSAPHPYRLELSLSADSRSGAGPAGPAVESGPAVGHAGSMQRYGRGLDGCRAIRESAADESDQIPDQRDRIADERDQIADERDQIADERDQLADVREAEADRREAELEVRAGELGVALRNLQRSAEELIARSNARITRSRAQMDREQAAADREEAAIRREAADTGWSRSETRRLHHDAMSRAEANIKTARALRRRAGHS